MPCPRVLDAAALRPGPALALLFALGLALNTPGSHLALAERSLGAPALRWAIVALLIAAIRLRRANGARRPLAALLALALGALRGSGGTTPAMSITPGPVRIEAWVAEVPAVIPPRGAPGPAGGRPPGGARTTFLTEDPALRVSIDGIVPWIAPGQRLRLAGRVLPPRGPRNPGDPPRIAGPPFLRVERPEAVQLLEHRPLRRPLGGITLALRERAHRLIEALYPPRTAGFLLAMVLGDRRLLPEEYRTSMARTGTIHFLAVSGLNVGMAMALVVRLPLPRRIRLAARMGFLLAFTLVTGGAPPVVRAAVMLSIHCLGDAAGRSPRPLDTLAWSGIVILAVEPAWILDVGFWLSVSAVFAILVWAPPLSGEDPSDLAAQLRAAVRPAPPPGARRLLAAVIRAARRSLATALAASAGTAPLVLLVFYRVHPLGPLWNLILGPLVNAVLLLAGLSVALAGVHPFLGMPAAWATDSLSRLLLVLLGWMEAVPGSCIHLPPPPVWAALGVQGLIALGALPAIRRPALTAAIVLAAGLGAVSLLRAPPVELLILDVGEGSAALLRAGKAGNWLFDCGSSERGPGAGERIARALLASGVRRLEGLVLSHPHADHVGAAPGLCEVIPVARAWVAPRSARHPLGRWVEEELARRGVPVEALARGQKILGGGNLVLEVLHPTREDPLRAGKGPNDGSLVLRAVLDGQAILFPGDIEEAGTARLLAAGPAGALDLSSRLIVLPHHARESSLLDELLLRVRPEAALASGGGAPDSRATVERLRARGLRVEATWERGALRASRDGDGWRIEPAAGSR